MCSSDLQQLEPLSALSKQRLEELLPLTEIKQLALGQSLFREGDVDNQIMYLLQGEVLMSSSDGKLELALSHKVAEARYPLDDSQPHMMSCVAKSKVWVVYIDNSVLDYLMTWDQIAVAESMASPPSSGEHQIVESLSGSDEGISGERSVLSEQKVPVYHETGSADNRDWIRRMRQVMAFKNLPPANIRRLLDCMETIPVRAGEVLVRQGDKGDFYYVITEGEARVTQSVELAKLKAGDSFGEEALLTGVLRNATVSMMEDGQLMRLAKKDFDLLLTEPMLKRFSAEEAQQQVKQGACWLDVRYAKEHMHHHLSGSINSPVHELRSRLGELDNTTPYICYCSTGRRSSAAAFLLAQKGYQAGVLSGGIQIMNPVQASTWRPTHVPASEQV